MQPRANTLRHAIMLALAGTAFGFASLAVAQERSFDIPATDAAVSLPEYARQAGVQIVAPGEQLRDMRTPAVKGTMDTRAALGLLLAGTGLRVAEFGDDTITLNAAVPRSNLLASLGGAASAQAVAPQTPAVAGDQQEAAVEEVEVRDLSTVTVTGSFIRRIDTETALPVTTLDREDIDLSGASTVSDMLGQLPQAAGFDNSETSTGPNDARGDAASINLRGIGSGNTLVLLNGRRIAPHPISAGAVPRLSSNINQIPLGAVQRVEVLRDGASALYGSDAVAGVVNTILRKDYDGAEASIRHGGSDDGSMDETSASFLAGRNFNDARTNVMGFVGYYHRDALEASSKDFTQSADLRERAGSDDTRWDNRSLSGPYGNFTLGTANPDGTFTPHGIDGFGPRFHAQPGDGGGVGIGDGSLPRSLRYDFTPEYVLLPETTRYQAFGALNHAFDGGMEAFAQVFYYRAESVIANAASPISSNSDNDIYVPASNYYNPFGTRFYGPGTANPDQAPSDVLINNYRPVELGLRSADVTSRAYQVLGGLRGWMSDSWQWEAAVQYGEGKTTDVAHNMMSESRLREQLALDTPDAFNAFGGPGANSEAVLDAVRIDNWRTGEASLGIVDAKATGDLFEIGGGPVQAAVGVEYRRGTFSDRRDDFSNGNDVIALSQSSDSDGSRNVTSAFAEVSVPFFSSANAITGFQRLELSLAVRSEHYSDFGTATKPKVGLAWSPVESLLLRGSYNEGFRAPTLAQVFVGEISRRSGGVPDPYRADVTGTPADLGDETRQVVRGGNANLGPEEAKQHSFGVVFQPTFVKGLSLSADYFEIKQSDVIDTYGQEQQLELDFRLRTSGQGFNPDVVRLPVTPADEAAFAQWNATHPDDQRAPVGAIDHVRDTYINIARRKVSGIDFGLNYRLRDTSVGDFSFKAAYARMNTFEQQRDADSPAISDLEMNGLPKGRGVASVYWKGQRLDAGLRGNYISGFYDTSAPWDENENMFRVDSWLTFNAFVGFRFSVGSGNEDNSYLRFGVNNLLDEDPPFADENRAFYESIHDPRGRFLYAEWRVQM